MQTSNVPTETVVVSAPATQPTAATEATPAPRAPRQRRPKEKVRPLEELKQCSSIKSLSDKEKNILIEHLRAETNRLAAQANSYQHNAEEAFRKARMLEDAYNNMLKINNAKLNDIAQAANTFYKTIILIAKEGTKND